MTDSFGTTGSSSSRDQSRRAQEGLVEQAQVIRDDLREFGSLGKQAAKDLVGEAKRTATATYQQGKKQVAATGDRVLGYVDQNPWKALLFAAAAGAIIGAIVTRRR
jgi:ElaB/YqjD/DUF883 family membrane-anchored ribosome-binding protein